MNDTIVIRGGGDLATGVIQKFFRSGFNVVILETHAPTAIRRRVSLCEAVYDGESTVEDMYCRKVATIDEFESCWSNNVIPLLIDPDGLSISSIKPDGVIDAIIAKKNVGTSRQMANITIALGPGFYAGKDVDVVIETMRGHDLGRLIFDGYATSDTGVPAEIAGESTERVIYATIAGEIRHIQQIGNIVKQGEALLKIDDMDVNAPIGGLLRGLVRDGMIVKERMKIADIDKRTDIDYCTISDKARCLGGAALEAYLHLKRNGRKNNDS
ncbi:MAG: selenium-dependent molybdenum cofactor biosynthesis protein YqeB [Oscillospiraceae bacterium]|nr:selenium-dependent molybdenum cofactor biosynthesis protein YqeB [Oscillospiraceae bacterium]